MTRLNRGVLVPNLLLDPLRPGVFWILREGSHAQPSTFPSLSLLGHAPFFFHNLTTLKFWVTSKAIKEAHKYNALLLSNVIKNMGLILCSHTQFFPYKMSPPK